MNENKKEWKILQRQPTFSFKSSIQNSNKIHSNLFAFFLVDKIWVSCSSAHINPFFTFQFVFFFSSFLRFLVEYSYRRTRNFNIGFCFKKHYRSIDRSFVNFRVFFFSFLCFLRNKRKICFIDLLFMFRYRFDMKWNNEMKWNETSDEIKYTTSIKQN